MRTVSGIAQSLVFSLALAASAHGETPLARAFAEAWQRQPAAAALGERERAVAAQRAAALHALALRGVSESDHALAVKALGEIEYHARALAVILAPGSVPSGAAARVTAPGSVA